MIVVQWMRRLEAGLALALAWVLVFWVPAAWWLRLFGSVSAPVCRSLDGDAGVARARHVAMRIDRLAAALPWRSTCLVKAVAGRLLLARRGIAGGTIRLGVRRGQGGLEAHAWLLLGPAVLLGGEGGDGFHPMADLVRR